MKTFGLLLLLFLSLLTSPTRAQQEPPGQTANSQTASPQTSQTASQATRSDREQDGLKGIVRRIQVESAKIVEKDGKEVEGPKVLRATVTYDMQGKRVDTVSYPVETTTPAGNLQYGYDDKGNIIEKIVRASDGSILGKEGYKYEFDELGNWKKMTTSVAVYENGKVGYDPIEVTYRTITYYYNDAIEKIASSKPNAETASNRPTSSQPTAPPAQNQTQTQTQTVAAAQSTSAPSITTAKENANLSFAGREADKNANAAQSTSPKNAEPVTNSAAQPTETSNPTQSQPVPTTKLEAKAVTEEQLRKAAISLPQPEYPTTAELAGRGGKVEVQVIVDEKGDVVAAKSVSGESILYPAAEAAALKAHFSPAVLSAEPTRVFGVIAYNFAAMRGHASVAQLSNETNKPVSDNANTKPISTPATPSTGDASSFYQQGLAHLRAGRNADAVEVLRRAVYLNPQDAVAYGKLGLAYSALGQHTEAIAAFKLAVQIKPDVLEAEENYRLGEEYTAIGKHSDALKAFKQALHVAHPEAINPASAQANQFPTVADLHFGLGLAYYNNGNFNESIKELKMTIMYSPDLAEAHYGIALAYMARGDRASAQHEETILRKLNPALADNVAAALPSVVPPGTTRVTPREDRKPRP